LYIFTSIKFISNKQRWNILQNLILKIKKNNEELESLINDENIKIEKSCIKNVNIKKTTMWTNLTKKKHVQEWIIFIQFKFSRNNEIIDVNNNHIMNNKYKLDNNHELDIINVNVNHVITRKNLELIMTDCR
jgi:hypothetical protein